MGDDSEGSFLISRSFDAFVSFIEGVVVVVVVSLVVSIGSVFTVVVGVASASCIVVSLSRVGDVVEEGADVVSWRPAFASSRSSHFPARISSIS